MRRLTLALPLLAACTTLAEPDPCEGATTLDIALATPSSGSCVALSDMEQGTAGLINDYRDGQCLVPLVLDACVAEIARAHSQDMSDGSVAFGHDGFDDRAAAIIELLPSSIVVGENVAMNQGYADPSQTAYEGWLNSPPHLENIETPEYNLTGMGVVEDATGGFWFTQLFVGVQD